jgi:ABC-type nitrate/sulfonate/bicarbonate transport system substrate-binding protein
MALPASDADIAQALVAIAQEAGLFTKYGINAKLIVADGGSAAQQLVVAGSAEFATGSVEAALVADTEGYSMLTPIRLYAGLNASLVVSQAFVQQAAKSGVTPSSSVAARLKVLNGSTLACPSVSSPFTVALNDSLSTVGASAKLSYVGTEEQVAVFARHSVQGEMMSSPDAELGIQEGGGQVWISGPKGQFPGYTGNYFSAPLTVSAAFYKKDPQAVVRVAAALIAASNMVKNDQAAAEQIMRKLNPSLSDAIFDQVWQSNEPALTNPVPTAADVGLVIQKFSGPGAAQVKKINPAAVLGAQIQSQALAMVAKQS